MIINGSIQNIIKVNYQPYIKHKVIADIIIDTNESNYGIL